MYKTRDDEPEYGQIPNVATPVENIYGKRIQLVDASDALANKSLNINNDAAIGKNPNRYKQHGFYFNADNCIACHACEAACAEKNETPAHLAFRSVGYLEGGSYPAVKRLNISMACNHCDNPVCLKGCPTRAYTKFAEYGAVLQDPDICFGCGYCTWVCPYNAPQLDTQAGHVSKCNMCVDRLEVGLKPACAAACLGGALDFGLIETTPENRDQLATTIPGFPDPSITQPNIRFQQKQSLPRELKRTDTSPVRYVREEQNATPKPGVIAGQLNYHSAALANAGASRQWNLRKLRSREDPLVLFTLFTQTVVGAFATLFLGPLLGLSELSVTAHPLAVPITVFALIALQTFALVISTMHLGRPHRFYRAFNNLRHSPVSREVAAVAVFYNLLGAYAVFTGLPYLFGWLPATVLNSLQQLSGWLAVIAGPIALYFMQRIYRIPARPFWNHWQVSSSFFGTMLSLGPLLIAVIFVPLLMMENGFSYHLLRLLAVPLLVGIAVETIGLRQHRKAMLSRGGEAEAAFLEQLTTFGKTTLARNVLLGVNLILLCIAMWVAMSNVVTLVYWSILAGLLILTALISRALFYVCVIPTTMPGAFFWKNPGFQQHARQSGLAAMPQVGVQIVTH